MKTMTCPRCEGTGNLPCFNHVAAGTCFRCNGAKIVAYRAPAKVKAAPVLLDSDMLKIENLCSGDPIRMPEKAVKYYGMEKVIAELRRLWAAGAREISRGDYKAIEAR